MIKTFFKVYAACGLLIGLPCVVVHIANGSPMSPMSAARAQAFTEALALAEDTCSYKDFVKMTSNRVAKVTFGLADKMYSDCPEKVITKYMLRYDGKQVLQSNRPEAASTTTYQAGFLGIPKEVKNEWKNTYIDLTTGRWHCELMVTQGFNDGEYQHKPCVGVSPHADSYYSS